MSIKIDRADFRLAPETIYQTEGGVKVGPLRYMPATHRPDYPWVDTDNGRSWTDNGEFHQHCTSIACASLNIVSVWRAPERNEHMADAMAYAFQAFDVAGKPPFDIKAHIADKAKAIVTGARRQDYGTPEQNFERIARFWQAYFENTGRGAVAITAADVSPLMRLMKEARLCETPGHYDSFVDLVGYSLTGAEVNGVDVPSEV